jgi:hypothetical protein
MYSQKDKHSCFPGERMEKKKNILLEDYFVNRLFALNQSLINANSEEEFLQLLEETDYVSQNIYSIIQLKQDSLLDMQGTIKKFLYI